MYILLVVYMSVNNTNPNLIVYVEKNKVKNMDKIVTLNNINRLVDNLKQWVSLNFTPKTDGGVLIRSIISDETGKVTIENIDGYTFLNAISYDNNYPLNVIRFGDYFYVGYYGGQSEPNASEAVSLMFTTKANQTVTVFYVKNDIKNNYTDFIKEYNF